MSWYLRCDDSISNPKAIASPEGILELSRPRIIGASGLAFLVFMAVFHSLLHPSLICHPSLPFPAWMYYKCLSIVLWE
jgi:hypothetical protein